MEYAENSRAAGRQAILLKHLRSVVPTSQEAPVQAQACLAGDSAAYERRASGMDDVVIISAFRTPMCKAKRGALKDCPADDMLATVLQATVDRTGVEPEAYGDVVIGSVLGPSSQRANECRIAMFLAGYPETVPVRTVNRQCSSGLQAVADVAAAIKAGFYTVGVAGGVEAMSQTPMAWEGGVNPRAAQNKKAMSCLIPMGVTSENVAAKYGISRDLQDKMAVSSHQRAAKARDTGRFKDEIVPVKTNWKDPKTGEEKEILVEHDDGIRPDISTAALAKLKAVFKKDGTTTAGNSSQVTDGAAAVLMMTRREAVRRQLPILGIFRSFAAVGVDPAIMGVGPAVAIPEAVKQAGLAIDDIDLFELNEAFASQATYCCDKLGLDREKVNVNGGAIALGHPLGCTGARCTATLLHEMQKRGKASRFGVVSMCIGSGMGAAAVFERGGEIDEPRNVRPAQKMSYLSRDAQ
ncbi:3-ketoacyl-CoA thiolase 2, peroxisomal [Trebouxia sp. C0009 RCD-2024]